MLNQSRWVISNNIRGMLNTFRGSLSNNIKGMSNTFQEVYWITLEETCWITQEESYRLTCEGGISNDYRRGTAIPMRARVLNHGCRVTCNEVCRMTAVEEYRITCNEVCRMIAVEEYRITCDEVCRMTAVEEYRITCDGVCRIAYKDACRNTFEGAYLIFPDKHVRQMRRPSDNLLFYFDLSSHYQSYMFSVNMFNTIELNEISDKHTFLINLNHSMASCHNGQKLLLQSRIDYIY